jgi:CTD kinase subunit alpha
MARSRRTPPMRDHWRAEEEARDRAAQRYRDTNRSERRPRTPPFARREDLEDRYRGPDPRATESYRPSSNREPVRESKRPQPRKASPPPRRGSKPKHSSPQRSRGLEDRIAHPRDSSPTKPAKRRRTRSPSPARSDRYVPSHRRDSRSRDRSEPRDRRLVGTDRAFSSRRSSPNRDPRSDRRSQIPSSDSYVPSHRRRDRSRSRSPPRNFDRRSRSPRRRSRSPPTRSSPTHHNRKRKPDNEQRELSPYSARALKTQQLSLAAEPRSSGKNMNHPQRIQSVVDNPSISTQGQNYQGGHDTMGSHGQMRGNFGAHNNNMIHQNRPPRPLVDTRSSYQGSPPFMTPNSSYHGSPQSGSPFNGNRGGWSGNQSFQGHQG